MGFASPVEILIGGKAYSSLQEYRASKIKKSIIIQGPVSDQDEQLQRAQSAQLGIAYDPKKVKTISIVSKAEQLAKDKLKAGGIESKIGRVTADFEQNWDHPSPKFTITTKELEGRLKAELGGRSEPIILLSDYNKLRIMALEYGKTQ